MLKKFIPAFELPHNEAIMATIAITVIWFIVEFCENQSSVSNIFLKEKQESDPKCTLDFLYSSEWGFYLIVFNEGFNERCQMHI